ncbi:hypothetical protein [Pseudoalteromonas marina]|uniref:Uncharacterized protein n=1 Tax=Pseudoalteromonas marina TaxID=267375 RepID=A0ABT9FCG3_9GAMM|nr:hypothetical protein [Pseudoalteromonas marina]MDP2564423.1 hypothetical protein [Pseudoalteromonas marina]
MTTSTQVEAHKEFKTFGDAKRYWETQCDGDLSVFGSFVKDGYDGNDEKIVIGIGHLSLEMLVTLQEKQELVALVKYTFEHTYDVGLGLKETKTVYRSCISRSELNEVEAELSVLPKFELQCVYLGTLDKDAMYFTIPNYYLGSDLFPDVKMVRFFHVSSAHSAQKAAVYPEGRYVGWEQVDAHDDGRIDLLGTIEQIDGFDKRVVIPYGYIVM